MSPKAKRKRSVGKVAHTNKTTYRDDAEDRISRKKRIKTEAHVADGVLAAESGTYIVFSFISVHSFTDTNYRVIIYAT